MGNINWKEVGTKIGGAGLGAIGTKMILKVLPATVPQMWKGIGAMIIGAFLPTFIKSNFVEEVGSGMIAVGSQELASSFGFAVSGVEDPGYSVSARNMAIEQANHQLAEYIGEAEQFYNEVSGDEDFVAGDENFVAGEEDEVSEEIGAM